MIFLESNEVRSVGIILSGSVHMIKEDSEGYHTLLVTIKEGELFGESFSCGSHLDSRVSFLPLYLYNFVSSFLQSYSFLQNELYFSPSAH